MITGPLCRAARALVEVSRGKLALRSGVEETIIEQFERKIAKPASDDVEKLKATLEELGADFIPENTRGAGVRLKFTRAETRRIATLEGEGGLSGHDDVP